MYARDARDDDWRLFTAAKQHIGTWTDVLYRLGIDPLDRRRSPRRRPAARRRARPR
jgi:hypothetical protein